MHTLKLLNLQCHVSDETGLDEVYLKLKGDRIWPQSGKYEQVPLGTTPLNISIPDIKKGEDLEIELWDYDSFSKDDKLGTFSLVPDQFGSGFQTEMKKSKGTQASYSVEWEFY